MPLYQALLPHDSFFPNQEKNASFLEGENIGIRREKEVMELLGRRSGKSLSKKETPVFAMKCRLYLTCLAA